LEAKKKLTNDENCLAEQNGARYTFRIRNGTRKSHALGKGKTNYTISIIKDLN